MEKLAPVSGEYTRLMDDPAEIDRILTDGAEKARAVAAPVIKEAKKLVGYWS